MSHINILLNYYIENSYLNLNNNISIEDLNLLLENINKFNIIITIINIPNNFKYYNIIQNFINNNNINININIY